MDNNAEKHVETKEFTDADVCVWVEEHGDYLFRFAYKHFRDDSICEELVQDTLLAAVQSKSRFQGNSSAKTWLTAILKNKIIDRIRKQQRNREVSIQQLEEDGLSSFFDDSEHWRADVGPVEWKLAPETVLEQKQFLAAMGDCLAKLPKKFRDVFVMREVDGFERDEICKAFDLTATNVGVILHRARIALRDCIQVNWLKA